MSRLINIVPLLLTVVLLMSGCNDKGGEVQKMSIDSVNVELLPDQMSWNSEVHFIDSTITKAILKTQRARVYNERKETLLDGGMEVTFMSKTSGKRVSLLTADSGRIDDRTRNMRAMGNVVVISDSNNMRLETTVLEWDNDSRKLYSTEYVEITSPTEIIRGIGFESDQNLTNINIFKTTGARK